MPLNLYKVLTLGCIILTAQICDGLVKLTAINHADLVQHVPLSGNMGLPWRCEVLQGMVQVWCGAPAPGTRYYITTSCLTQTSVFHFRTVAS